MAVTKPEAIEAFYAAPSAATARALARCYVVELLARGYTEAKAQAEIFMGMSGPRDPGYCISHGSIRVPGLGELGRWRFAELAEEAERGDVQGSLF